jgi:hypothetical protein
MSEETPYVDHAAMSVIYLDWARGATSNDDREKYLKFAQVHATLAVAQQLSMITIKSV